MIGENAVDNDGDDKVKKAVRAIMYRNLEGDVEDLLSYVERIEKQRDDARERVREWNKDSEIQQAEDRVKEAYKQLSKGFAPDDNQWKQIEEWEKKHTEKYHKYPKVEGFTKWHFNSSHFSYQFAHTQLGTLGEVVCTVCADKAIRNSLGSMSKYHELMKKYEASFYFGEV